VPPPARPGVFSLIKADLRGMLSRLPVSWSDASLGCFDALSARCRAHGEVDVEVVPMKDAPYYTDPWAADGTTSGSKLLQRTGQCG
jgi:hypothetical protein